MTDAAARAGDRPILEARGITKRFPGVIALDGASLTLRRGEIVAVVGENGAGKSTFMKVLAGIESPDEGTLAIDGAPVTIGSSRRAIDLGIVLIHQELCLATNLSVGANIFLGREPRRFGVIDEAAVREQSSAALERIGARVSPDEIVGSLAIGEQQSVEIVKALAQDARVLILDEPTSSLSLAESDHLFRVLRSLRERGVSIVYISHRLGEVKAIADRVVVLRDGRNAGELAREEIDRDAMVRLMVGRDVRIDRSVRGRVGGTVVLAVDGLRTTAYPGERVDFAVRRGELVGIAGLVGAGRTELLRALFCIDRREAGRISIEGVPATIRRPKDAVRAGIGFVPEDRKQHGLFLEMALVENIGVVARSRPAARGIIDRSREEALAHEMIDALSIRAAGIEQVAGVLSGGNQQKVVLAKWLAIRPRLLLLDEPTRGIDVGARQEIYALIRRLVDGGVAVLFASSEMEEILTLSDRALVMHAGRIAGELSRDALTEEAVMRLATGSIPANAAT